MPRNPFLDDPAELDAPSSAAVASIAGTTQEPRTALGARPERSYEADPARDPLGSDVSLPAADDGSDFSLPPPHPADWRAQLRLWEGGPPWGELLTSWQAADFAATDPAWLAVADLGPVPPRRKSWVERPRGHSKTTDAAAELSWVMLHARRALRGYVVANDEAQAALLTAAIAGLAAANPADFEPLEVNRISVKNHATGAELRLMGRDVGGSFGITPDFLMLDELTHWPKESAELWVSLSSSAAKRPDCVLLVRTNAGRYGTWQHKLREKIRKKPDRWHFSTMAEPLATWIDPEELADQRDELTPADFARLWLNQWQGRGAAGRPIFKHHPSAVVRWNDRTGLAPLGW